MNRLEHISHSLRDLAASEVLVNQARRRLRKYALASIREAEAIKRVLHARNEWQGLLERESPRKTTAETSPALACDE